MRTIDADALKKSITDYHAGLFPRYISKLVDAEIEDIKDIIDEQITLDYAPVRHGEWIEDDTLFTRQRKCSLCGRCDNPKTAIRGHFCWYCGAKMDGGKSDGRP